MKKLFVLTIALLLLLSACVIKKDAAPPVADTIKENTNASKQSTSQDAIPLRIALYENTCECATLLTELQPEGVTLSFEESTSLEDAKQRLLDGNVDLLLLSVEEASAFYNETRGIRILAAHQVPDPASPDGLPHTDCLVALSDKAVQYKDAMASLSSAFSLHIQEKNLDATLYLLSTGWDMVDQVQQRLEANYAQNPDPSHSIPDGDFYYLPAQ